MAVNPVIVDDGGSTRIKHFRLPPSIAVGAMDGLLDVQPNAAAAGTGLSDHEFPVTHGPFTVLKVSSTDPATGKTTESVAVPAVAPGDKVEIISGAFTV